MATELKVGDLCFIPDAEHAYVQGTLSSVGDGGNAAVTLLDGTKKLVALKDLLYSPPECDMDDMTMIRNINHESAMVECVRLRYMQRDQMYTYVGTGVLIAVNPFQPLAINRPQEVPNYKGRDPTEKPPHIFILADQAYKAVSQEFLNQTFIVSGESGAGKTESCKLVMSYLSLANAKFLSDGTVVKSGVGEAALAEKLMDQIMASNPVLEAFGNAKSVRNNNSSRFGKFLRMDYVNGVLKGARMNNYLLEKSRVVWQGPEERNYHIFYQLLCGCPSDLQKSLGLNNRSPGQWEYLKMSGCTTVPGMDDREEFIATAASMTDIGVSNEEKNAIFSVLAAILHLGDIQFSESGDGSNPSKEPLSIAANLLQLFTEDMTHALCFRHMTVGGEEFIKPNPVPVAADTRDTISKTLYSKMFDWIFLKLNEVLKPAVGKDGVASFFGILDIFGFEIFKKNSFEQLCINYTNEKLQQIFILRVFLGEQQEYASEGLKWEPVDYSDNKPCCDLIEAPKIGVLAMLDEEGTVPKGSDLTWVEKMHQKHGTNPFYTKPRIAKTEFIINHYAGPVTYECTGFMDKNKDFVHPDIIKLLAASKLPFVASIFKEDLEYVLSMEEAAKGGGGSGKKPTPKATASRSFLRDLNSLGDVLLATPAWYVRCLKPNQAKKPRMWGGAEVCRQLRYNNVLETIRVRQLGFLYRRPFDFFIRRFWMCADGPPMSFHPTRVGGDEKGFCEKMVNAIKFPPEISRKNIAIGRTKIFVKSAVELDEIEKIRKIRLGVKCVVIQSKYKSHYYYTRFKKIKVATRILQSHLRKALCRRPYLAAFKSCVLLQSRIRRSAPRHFYRALLVSVSLLLGSKVSAPVKKNWMDYRSSAEVVKQTFTRSKFVFRRKAVQRIQAAMRRVFVSNSLAVARVQAAYRRVVQWRMFMPKRVMIAKIQAHLRRLRARRSYLIRKAAANAVKKLSLRFVLRKRYRLSFAAADKLRSFTRQFLYREQLCEARLAAIDLESRASRSVYQRFFRVARRKLWELQAVCRRQIWRRRYHRKLVGSLMLQPVLRRKRLQKHMGIAILAAIRLEARIRRLLYRKRLGTLRLAAIALQKHLRLRTMQDSHICGRDVSVRLEYVARRTLVRRKYMTFRAATVAIQSLCKRRVHYRKYYDRRCSTVAMQAATARCYVRMLYGQVYGVVRFLQAAILRPILQNRFRVYRLSATRVKSRCRFALLRIQHCNQRSSVKLLQYYLRRSVAAKILSKARVASSQVQTVIRRKFIRSALCHLRLATVVLQSYFMGGVWRHLLTRVRAATNIIKAAARAKISQLRMRLSRRTVKLVQSRVRRSLESRYWQHFRGHIKMLGRRIQVANTRREFLGFKYAILDLQRRFVMVKAHHQYLNVIRAVVVLEEMQRFGSKRNASILIQAHCREAMVRWWFIVGRFAAVLLQSYLRRALLNHHIIIMKQATSRLGWVIKRSLQRGRLAAVRRTCLQLQRAVRSSLHWQVYTWAVLSSIRLQAHLRRHLYRSMFVYGRTTCSAVQSALSRMLITRFYHYLRYCTVELQSHLRRAVRSKEHQDMRAAASQLQRGVRRGLARLGICWTVYATTVLFSACQRVLYRCGFKRARACAQRIQATVRRCIVRNQAFLIPRSAALQIQAAALRIRVFHRCQRLRASARVLQAATRRAFWRRLVGVVRYDTQVITRACRRTLARGTYCIGRTAAIVLQASCMRKIRYFNLPTKRKAAVAIEKFARRALCFYGRAETLGAASIIQATIRRKASMCKLSTRVKHGVVLASALERSLCRNYVYAVAVRSVLKLQTSVRRALGRLSYARLRWVSVGTQAAVRRCLIRRRYCLFQKQNVSSVVLKSCVRRMLCRWQYCGSITGICVAESAIQRLWNQFMFQRVRIAAVVIEASCKRLPRYRQHHTKKKAAQILQARVLRCLWSRWFHDFALKTQRLQAACRQVVRRRVLGKHRVQCITVQARIRRTVYRREHAIKKLRAAFALQQVAKRAVLSRIFRRKRFGLSILRSALCRLVYRRRFGHHRASIKLLQSAMRRIVSRRKFLARFALRQHIKAAPKNRKYLKLRQGTLMISYSMLRSIKRAKHFGRFKIYSALRWLLRRQVNRRPYEQLVRSVRQLHPTMLKAHVYIQFLAWRKSISLIQAAYRRRRPRSNFIGKPDACVKLHRVVRRKLRQQNLGHLEEAQKQRYRYLTIRSASAFLLRRLTSLPSHRKFVTICSLVRALESLRLMQLQRRLYVRARACMAGFVEWTDEEGISERWVTLKAGALHAYRKLGDTTPAKVVTLNANFQVEIRKDAANLNDSNSPSSQQQHHRLLVVVSSGQYGLSVDTTASRLAWVQALLYAQHMKWLENRSLVRAWARRSEGGVDMTAYRLQQIRRCALDLLHAGHGAAPTSTGLARSILLPSKPTSSSSIDGPLYRSTVLPSSTTSLLRSSPRPTTAVPTQSYPLLEFSSNSSFAPTMATPARSFINRTVPENTPAGSSMLPSSTTISMSPELTALLQRLRSGETPTPSRAAPTTLSTTSIKSNPFAASITPSVSRYSQPQIPESNTAQSIIGASALPSTTRSVEPDPVASALTVPTTASIDPLISGMPSISATNPPASSSGKRLLILASPSRNKELIEWVQTTLYNAANKNQVAMVRVIGQDTASSVSRTLRPLSPVLAARVQPSGETVDDALKLLARAQPATEHSVDLFILLWDATGHGSSEFARLLSAAGRARVPTALNVANANRFVNDWV